MLQKNTPGPGEAVGAAGVCSSPSGFLLVLLASTALALCLALVDVRSLSDFWPVFGMKAVFIVLVTVSVAATYCYLAPSLVKRFQVADSLVLFLLVQFTVLVYSLVVISADDLLSALNLPAHVNPEFFLIRNMVLAAVGGLAVARYMALQQRWKSQVAAESRARLDSLQSRIRPHFLFNALNTISSLIHDKPDQAEQATMDLSDLLRTGLREDSHHTLAEELELVRGYLRIESLRLGDRLQVEWELDDDLPLDLELPALLIQPLVENAVVHGIARLSGRSTLNIRGERHRRKRLRFVIENPVPETETESADGNRMALENIRQRLELAWEEGARLKTGRSDDRFRVELVVPVTD